MAIVALVLALCGCTPHTHLDPHFLAGFVPGSQNIFRPVKIAVATTTTVFPAGELQVGLIYDPNGEPTSKLFVADAAAAFNEALTKGLADAGLEPVVFDTSAGEGTPPEGCDYVLASEIDQFEVNKRFGANYTVHGRYFTMNATVRVKYWLRNRANAMLYSGEMTGIENEPPTPVGGEVFLPLETEPVESLSVALSRAVGLLVVAPDFQAALPMRAAQAAGPSPGATPSPAHR